MIFNNTHMNMIFSLHTTSDLILFCIRNDIEECEVSHRYFLQIYGLPEFTLLYEVHHFTDLPSMLYDHRGWRQSSSNNGPCQFG